MEDEAIKARLSEMINELNLQDTELTRIRAEKNIIGRLSEMQAIYERKKSLRDEAYKVYNDNKLTMSILIDESSFSRPTLYKDPLLRRYAEFLVKKSRENDFSEKMQRALADKQNIERYNDALVSDILELMHAQEECTRLVEQTKQQAQRIAELEAKIGIKSNILQMESRVTSPPSNLDGVFPIDIHRD